MTDTTGPEGSVNPNMAAALDETIRLADRLVDENRGVMVFARPSADAGWQDSQYQRFFLQGIYQMLNPGARSACNAEIIGRAVTPEAESFIRARCLNPYWFWAVIGAAAAQAKTLPLTLGDVKCGTEALLKKHTEPMSHTHHSGWPSGYSGPETPWHIHDALSRGILWNNDLTRESGLTCGMIMLQRAKSYVRLKGRFRRLPSWQSFDGMAMIFNPLFQDFAVTPPAVSTEE